MELTWETDTRGVRYARILLTEAPEILAAELQKASLQGSSVILRKIKRKLSGEVLKVRTGNLRRSFVVVPPKRIPGGVGFVGGVSTNVAYAPIHEFGFEGDISVRAHSRRSKKGVAYQVQAHGRVLAYKGRPYARPSVAESAEEVRLLYWRATRRAYERFKK